MLRAYLDRPWFRYRPTQIARRLWRYVRPAKPGYRAVPTAWGVPVVADLTKTIGRAIDTTGIYELAVSEALVRLIPRGGCVVDAGANIGYMTVLAAATAGPGGRVLSFEPHPDVFAILKENVRFMGLLGSGANVDARNHALGAESATAQLEPGDFDSNDGVSRITRSASPEAAAILVQVQALDDVIGGTTVDVLKIDVEGWELEVLKGAQRALDQHRIRHIIFEDHDITSSQVPALLARSGYHVRSLSWNTHGLVLGDVSATAATVDFEPASFLATADPADAWRRCEGRGWRVLKPIL